MTRYRYATTLTWTGFNDEVTGEIEVEVEFSVAWGSPESGRFGPPERYDPGSPHEVEDIKVLTIDGKPGPWAPLTPFETAEATIIEKLELSDRDLERMLEIAVGDEIAARDDYAESRAEERRLEARS